MKNYLLSPASDTGLEVQHNLLRLVKSPPIRQKSLQYTSHAAHSSHCQVRRSIWLEVEGTQHAVNSTLLLLLLIPLSVPLLLPIVNPAGRGWLVSRHSCCKFFPKVVEALVVAGQSDVLPDGLWVEALAEMELSIGDQGEVGAKIIPGNPVELAYHRCKWGSSPDLVILGVFLIKLVFFQSYRLLPNPELLCCLLGQEVLVDVGAGGLHRELVQTHNLGNSHDLAVRVLCSVQR